MERSMSVHIDSRDHVHPDPVPQDPSFWPILRAGYAGWFPASHTFQLPASRTSTLLAWALFLCLALSSLYLLPLGDCPQTGIPWTQKHSSGVSGTG
jgi:hypothetical protein